MLSSIARFLLVLSLALPAFGALSPKYKEWREGPIQWVLTPDEQQEWKALKTDEEAIRFIDLFWARRDPTPGHPVNEFRDDFNFRVKYSDDNFSEPRRRGAMTDRGRVFILLGPPTGMGGEGERDARTSGGGDALAGRTMGARYIWEWTHADAQKFDMPKIEIYFIGDPTTKKVQRDPQRGDFSGAHSGAMKKMIVARYAELPAWAPSGGLEPKFEAPAQPRVVVEQPVAPPVAELEEEEPETTEAPGSAATTGITRLILLNDLKSVSPKSPTDPFAGLTPVTTFASGKDVGWVAEFCSSKPEVPKLQLIVRLRSDEGMDSVTRAKEVKPARMASAAGCYLLRGEMTLKKVEPGKYELGVLLDDMKTKETFDLYREFVVQ
jgi:GWxTD domain-containing protein